MRATPWCTTPTGSRRATPRARSATSGASSRVRAIARAYSWTTFEGPVYGDPVAGETVAHTWPHSGTFSVELTATDSTGRSASTKADVSVNNQQPILELTPDCPTNADGEPVLDPGCLPRTGDTATARRLSGVFGDVSGFDLTVFVNWGDGSDVVSDCVEVVPGHFVPFGEARCEDASGNGLDVQPAVDDQFSFDASHTYAEPGTYFGTIWVSDGVLGTSHAFTMTIDDTPDVRGFLGSHHHVDQHASGHCTNRCRYR